MKILKKATLLTTAITFAMSSLSAQADATSFKNDDDKAAYALGLSFAQNMAQFYTEQSDLGISLNKDQLVAGVQDALADKSKLSEAEVAATLEKFEKKLQAKAAEKAEKLTKEVLAEGEKFRAEFAKKPGAKKTKSGLLYIIDQAGSGDVVKESDEVVVNYRGTLVNGTEFDSSYARNKPATFPLGNVIKGWTEGLQLIKKGGKLTLVVPPELGYGARQMGDIPANSTLVFEIELIDVNPNK